MRTADYIADRLTELGAKDVFMVTGGGSMHLNDALGHRGDLRVTCCHHEQACAFAAEHRPARRVKALSARPVRLSATRFQLRIQLSVLLGFWHDSSSKNKKPPNRRFWHFSLLWNQ